MVAYISSSYRQNKFIDKELSYSMSERKVKPNVVALSGVTVVMSILGVVGVAIGLFFGSSRASVVSLALIGYPVYQYVSLKSTEYTITDDKVISDEDFGGEKHEEVGFDNIQNTSVKLPFFYQVVGNYGNISISTAGSNLDALTLKAVENPRAVHEEIVNEIDDVEHSDSDQEDSMGSNREYEKLAMASKRLKNAIESDKL